MVFFHLPHVVLHRKNLVALILQLDVGVEAFIGLRGGQLTTLRLPTLHDRHMVGESNLLQVGVPGKQLVVLLLQRFELLILEV
jgi:hypothetical protein